MRYFMSIRLALAPVNANNLFKAIPNQLVITVRSHFAAFHTRQELEKVNHTCAYR